MGLGDIRERFRTRGEAEGSDGASGSAARWLGPLLLALFFVLVVTVVVRMGGGEDRVPGGGTSVDNAAATGPEASAGASAGTDDGQPPVAAAGAIEGVVKARVALAVYHDPRIKGRPVLSADHGTKVMVECHTDGQVQYTNGKGDPTWARVIVQGKRGYVPVAQVDTGGDVRSQVPDCA